MRWSCRLSSCCTEESLGSNKRSDCEDISDIAGLQFTILMPWGGSPSSLQWCVCVSVCVYVSMWESSDLNRFLDDKRYFFTIYVFLKNHHHGIYLSRRTNQTVIYRSLHLEHIKPRFKDRTYKKFKVKVYFYQSVLHTCSCICLCLLSESGEVVLTELCGQRSQH